LMKMRRHNPRFPPLRPGGERRKRETESENEPDQPHWHLVEDGWRESS
jgi:hypothetical protein